MHRWLETNRTKLSLRVAYQMPANLDLYVGPAGVWGDVNDILQSGLYVMKVFPSECGANRLSTSARF